MRYVPTLIEGNRLNPLFGMVVEVNNMKLRFSLIGTIFLAFGVILFIFRGYHANFFIPMVVGAVLFLYGLLSR